MRCLITGGAGFIGSRLAEACLAEGHQVTVLDDLSTGRLELLAGVAEHIRFIRGDIRDAGLLHNLSRGMERVFHMAALAAVPATVNDPVLSAQINDIGTLNVMIAARGAGVGRVVYASSSAVYGNIADLPHRESIKPAPNNPYAAHKLLGEHYASMFGGLYGLEVVSLRYFNVFGPEQDFLSPCSGAIPLFMDRLLCGRQPVVYGDGGQSRDFVYIDDAVRGTMQAAEAPDAAGRVFNIGSGRAVTVRKLLETISKTTGLDSEPVYAPARPGDVYASRADLTLARAVLGFEPLVDLENGLARTWEWFMSHRPSPAGVRKPEGEDEKN